LVQVKTAEFQKLKKAAIAKNKLSLAQENTANLSEADKGQKVFNQNCAACHKPHDKLVEVACNRNGFAVQRQSVWFAKLDQKPGKKSWIIHKCLASTPS
jgi:cytochrome c